MVGEVHFNLEVKMINLKGNFVIMSCLKSAVALKNRLFIEGSLILTKKYPFLVIVLQIKALLCSVTIFLMC